MAMCGGTGAVQEANEEVIDMCKKIKAHLEKELGKELSELTPLAYKSQVVAGTNFFIKAHSGGEEFYHLRVFRPLPFTNAPPSLAGYQANKTREEEIEYFEV